ncbi:beta-1,3-galactosyltransferase 6-like [Rhopalosiphum padi]|uniref:beta-1,3-galactosyltransferase 6-like n=1 Tax=Rhopalosiphum padi TaxID=40932 RepID=UPI00298E3B38|nr:beta-1,3-galactosyltransferase 6-like [Rhopalosiphum padi]XP_060851835.1 beta-1,3-galactosyltransferase 6-like [Rhopalosiphum padi]XP_060851836.1 beta-1,3-galactosyltransferase 6-like [Rhopalosiphum padi]
MLLHKKRPTCCFLASFSFILGCILTLFVSYPITLISNTSPNVLRIKLLVLVLSDVKNLNQRDAIRETWAQTKGDFKILFVVSKDTFLNAEKLLHDDILEVDEKDEFRLLTRKITASFSSVYDINFDYLLKCDDDSFVNVPLIVNDLEHMPKQRFYWGYFDGAAPIKDSGKYKETGWIACNRYLPYALGGGYVLSKDLIIFIVKNRDYLSFFASEDVSVGAWLSPLNITRKHDRRFDTEWCTRGCQNTYLVTHKVSPEMMRQYWSNIIQTGKLCDKEFKTRASYEYNWSVKPSECCVRNLSLIP